MALEISTGNILQVRMNFNSPEQGVAYNVHHYKVASISGGVPGGPAALSAIAQYMHTQHAALWAPFASNEMHQTGCTVTNIWPLPRSVSYTYTPVAPVDGLVDDEALPMQDTITILKRTAVGNRWGLGRTFLVGFPESSQEDGGLTAGVETALRLVDGWWGEPRTVTGTGFSITLNPVLITQVKGMGITRTTDVTSSELSNGIFKTQRRRRPGKGI